MTGALHGIKILEIANYISGPFVSILLADQGADVTNVEYRGREIHSAVDQEKK